MSSSQTRSPIQTDSIGILASKVPVCCLSYIKAFLQCSTHHHSYTCCKYATNMRGTYWYSVCTVRWKIFVNLYTQYLWLGLILQKCYLQNNHCYTVCMCHAPTKCPASAISLIHCSGASVNIFNCKNFPSTVVIIHTELVHLGFGHKVSEIQREIFTVTVVRVAPP